LCADDLNLTKLAVAVIQQAFRDALWRPTTTASADAWHTNQRRQCDRARWFLQHSDQLNLWSALAGINADRVRDAINDGLLDREQNGRSPFGGQQGRGSRRSPRIRHRRRRAGA